jgi:hypothetical protein
MTEPRSAFTPERQERSTRKRILEERSPKIVDEQKYYGPAVADFRAIKKRMKEIS